MEWLPGFIGMLPVLFVIAGIVYILFTITATLLTAITEAIWPPKDERCDCVTKVEHTGFGFVGVAGTSYIPDRDCPKCNGTGEIDPKSPYANKPSPVKGRQPYPTVVQAANAAAASIAASVQRDDDCHGERQRTEDDRKRDNYSLY